MLLCIYFHAGNELFPAWERDISMLGANHSQHGNNPFPAWEYTFPSMGIVYSKHENIRKDKGYVKSYSNV